MKRLIGCGCVLPSAFCFGGTAAAQEIIDFSDLPSGHHTGLEGSGPILVSAFNQARGRMPLNGGMEVFLI